MCKFRSLTDTSRSSEAVYPRYAPASGRKCAAVLWVASIRGPHRTLVAIVSVGWIASATTAEDPETEVISLVTSKFCVRISRDSNGVVTWGGCALYCAIFVYPLHLRDISSIIYVIITHILYTLLLYVRFIISRLVLFQTLTTVHGETEATMDLAAATWGCVAVWTWRAAIIEVAVTPGAAIRAFTVFTCEDCRSKRRNKT